MAEPKNPKPQAEDTDPSPAAPDDPDEARRKGLTAKQEEGSGAVPNVTPGQSGDPLEKAKEAAHELEEQKGDWGKSH